MSNNRKRNLKKLAKNIVGATALLSSLSPNMSASETNNSSSSDSSGKWIAGAGLAVAIAGVGSQAYASKKSADLGTASLNESQRHNKVDEERQEKKEQADRQDREVGVDQRMVNNVLKNLASMAGKFGKKSSATPEAIRQILAKRNAASRVLMAGTADGIAGENAMLKQLTDELLNDKSGKYVIEGLKKLVQAPKEDVYKNSIVGFGLQSAGGLTAVANLTRTQGAGVAGGPVVDGTNRAGGAQAITVCEWAGSGKAKYGEKAVEAWNAMLPKDLEPVMKNCGCMGVAFGPSSAEDDEYLVAANGAIAHAPHADILKLWDNAQNTNHFGGSSGKGAKRQNRYTQGYFPVVITLGYDTAATQAARAAANGSYQMDIIPVGHNNSSFSSGDANEIKKLAVEFWRNQTAPVEKNNDADPWE